jgi:hypothetical protein
MESVKYLARAAIDHGGHLPELPEFSIVLYSAEAPGNQLTQTMVEYMLRAFN